MRNDSAASRLEGNDAHSAASRTITSPTSSLSLLPNAAGSLALTENHAATPSTAAAAASKDKLSDRLARAAAGASGGRSTATRSRDVSPQPPSRTPQSTQTAPAKIAQESTASPSKATAITDAPSVRLQPRRQDSPSHTLSMSHARARLSSIEPAASRGGKAYERMLLAGTGLKSIGGEDDEGDEEDDGQGFMADEDDVYGGAVMEQVSPLKRQKTLKPNGSDAAKAGADVNLSRKSGRGSSTIGVVEDSDEDDATLINVEEMLESIDFRTVHTDPGRLNLGSLNLGSIAGGGAYSTTPGALMTRAKGQGTADVIEASLLSELEALESANIHSILNGDDRLATVLQHVDAALSQLDSIDSLVASFKLSLNSRAEDIGFIEGQNRGLQVMNSNWRALQREIEQLSQTINVPSYEVERLLSPDYDNVGAIEGKEAAAASLYKAILQARTSQMEQHHVGMAATTERLEEYSSISNSFAGHVQQHLSISFTKLTQALLADSARKAMLQPPVPKLTTHDDIEAALGAYCGLLLYIKEVEPKVFDRISAAYLTSAAERYKEECSRLMGVCRSQIRKASDDEDSISSFAQDGASGSGTVNALGRAATVRRIGAAASGGKKNKSLNSEGDINGSEAFNHIISSVSPLIAHESLFLSDFLHLNSNGLTFADYMDLEGYFRRRAAALYIEDSNERRGGLREMRGAMELVFGFFAGDVEAFLDEVSKKDRVQIVGVLASLDSALLGAEDAANEFWQRTLHKLHAKAKSSLDRFFADQFKAIAASANKSQQSSSSYAPSFRGKRTGRAGLVQSVRILPHFVERVEGQLTDAHHLGIRSVVDTFYDKLEQTIIDSLLSLKVDTAAYGGGGAQDDDKGVMNHQVSLIENMYHLVQEVNKLVARAPTLGSLVARAEKMYEESLSHYVHFVLRRPLSKMMDFGDGIDSLRGSTPASEVSLHSAYSKASFKRLVKEYTFKDVRKQVDALWRRVLKHFDEDEDESFSLSNGAKGGANSAAAAMLDSDELVTGSAAEEEERRRVVSNVWRRCESDFVKEIERMVRIQNECYKGSGATFELQVPDVVRLFQR